VCFYLLLFLAQSHNDVVALPASPPVSARQSMVTQHLNLGIDKTGAMARAILERMKDKNDDEVLREVVNLNCYIEGFTSYSNV
jgi:hypothetical protein